MKKNNSPLVSFYESQLNQMELTNNQNKEIVRSIVEKLQKNNALLVAALQPLADLADEVFKDTRKDKEGTLYAFNKAEIKYSDLRTAQQLLNSIKP